MYRMLLLTLLPIALPATSLADERKPEENLLRILPTLDHQTFDAGELFTGTKHEFIVKFSNLSGKPISFVESRTCCGTQIGIRRSEEIPHKGTSDFSIRISPSLRASKFAKSIELLTADGESWPIRIKAVYTDAFSLSEQSIALLDGEAQNKTYELSVKAHPDAPVHNFDVNAISGFVNVKEKSVTEGLVKLKLTIKRSVRENAHSLVERFSIVDRNTSKVISTVDLRLLPPSRLLHRPSKLRVAEQSDAVYKGHGIVVGNKQKLARVSDKGTINVMSRDGAKAGTGYFRVKARTDSLLSLEYTFDEDVGKLLDSRPTTGELLDENGVFCQIDSLAFSSSK